MKYRKKPVVIEAFQWTGGPAQTEDPIWILEAIAQGRVYLEQISTPWVVMRIATLEGVMIAQSGDFIIRGVDGELYPCKPEIFKKTYEAVE